ncbi:MAG: CcoQ/FixQ family Cbb3-type cytochrome c oxidase assembly chaperone [Bacteroidia bacterium]|nr:CcoQ/FixQ family Cbb3-type cytochrome c oxidase assembly chaperone [Bacteroidia bacterium]
MKFINYLESITGIGIYPMISFMIFFLFFLAVSIYLLKAGRRHFDAVAQIPLEQNQNDFNYEKE